MTEEIRVIGPPGCGKTTRLGVYVSQAVKRVGASKVLVASLTKTAAQEVAGRDTLLPKEAIGTLHAHAYRALRSPDLAETRKGLTGFNDSLPKGSMLKLTSAGSSDLDDGEGMGAFAKQSVGDELFSEYKVARSRMLPEELWSPQLRKFATRWEAFKADSDMLDFNDLITHAASDVSMAPNRPSVILADEAQDMDMAQFTLLRKWASGYNGVQHLIVVGDPDQNLYQWRGSDPEAWSGVPADQTIVLEQSYRVPIAVHGRAVDWISRAQSHEGFTYRPVDRPGGVYGAPSLADPLRLLDAVQRKAEEGTVMVLASCAYMLEPLVKLMKKQAVPFHNPWKPARGDWNPLRRGDHNTTTGTDRVLAWAGPELAGRLDWTMEELRTWLPVLTGVLKRGAKKQLKELVAESGAAVSAADLEQWFKDTDDAYSAYDPQWIEKHTIKTSVNGMRYPWAVMAKHGAEALRERPRITVGTIHSVKGAEADTVFLSPDLSYAGAESWAGGRGDAVRRLFYVGMTRAVNDLALMRQSGGLAVKW